MSKNKTVFCLLVILLFTSFFFARSVTVREQWIVPTFMSLQNYYQRHRDVTAFHLGFVNNWLKEDPVSLRFGLYMYPASVEMPTLDKRNFYASYPPGLILPIYLLFKALDSAGIFPDIYEKRGAQLLLLNLYNYLMHFLLVLTLCCLVFFICIKLNFDRLNSLLLAIIPAIVQFHNANSLYHHHAFYNMESAVMLPFALYVFLEFLRISYAYPRILQVVKVLQPLLMFYGVLTDWFFIFVIITVYTMRLIRKEIALPASLYSLLQWIKHGFLFFAPALAAIAVWIYQIKYYLQNIGHANLATATISAREMTLFDKFMKRVGLTEGIDSYFSYFKTTFITHINNGYGLAGLLIIFATFWTLTRCQKFMKNRSISISQAATVYLIFLIPCIAHNLFFIEHSHDHIYSSLKFSLALSLAFVLLPVFVLQMTRKDHLLPALQIITSGRNISLVSIVSLSSSLLYGYAQIHNKYPVTKMFSNPDYGLVLVGNFVKKNTSYRDVVFSDFYYLEDSFNTITVHFTNKVIHYANNLDSIYHKTKQIEQDFTIKILYHRERRQEAKKLTSLLYFHDISVRDVQEEKIGGLLAFNGREFHTWYEKAHECDTYPQRCLLEER